MKNAIIFHGTDCKPKDYWYEWLKAELEKAGHRVELPHYPDINHIPIEQFLPNVLNNHNFDEDTVLIGHSAGGPLLLSILENIKVQIKQAILVAGYSMRLPGEEKDPVLQKKYGWDTIKQNVKDIIFINSVNDPWGCDAKQGGVMFDKLGGTQIIRNDGHFGSTAYNQPYPDFLLLKALVIGAES